MLLFNILLWILKLIGIVILVILGIVLIVLCLLLFVPIRYTINAQYKGEVKVTARISYLLHAVRVKYELAGKNSSTDIRVLWFRLSGGDDRTSGRTGKKDHRERRKRPHTKSVSRQLSLSDTDKQEIKEPNTDNTIQQDKHNSSEPFIQEAEILAENRIHPETEIQTETDNQPEADKQSETDKKSRSDLNQSKDRKNNKKTKKSEKNVKISKNTHTKDKSGGIMDNIKSAVTVIKENRSVISFLIRQLKSLLRHILPGSHVINIRLGLDDPALLGELLGAAAVVRTATNLVLNITPVWNEKVFEAECSFKGRVLLGKILFVALRVYFNKDVKRIIHELKD